MPRRRTHRDEHALAVTQRAAAAEKSDHDDQRTDRNKYVSGDVLVAEVR